MDMGFFLQKERIFPGVHKIDAPIPGPRIADKNFTDTRIFLILGIFLDIADVVSNLSPIICFVNFPGSEFGIRSRGSHRSLLRRCTFLSSNSGLMIPLRKGTDPLQKKILDNILM